MQNESIFEFKYQGDIDSIDLNTLLVSQLQYVTILNEIQARLYPEIKLNIKVKSFERNSFDIIQFFEIIIVSGSLFMENKEYITEILKVLKSYIDLKKLLGDKKPDKIEQVVNENTFNIYGNGNVVVVGDTALNLYKTNRTIHKALIKNSEILEGNDEIQGIEIINKVDNEKVIPYQERNFQC
jgi:hypothetical protein